MSDLELCCMSMQRATLIELAEAAGHAGFQYITARAKHFADEPLSGSLLRRRIEECGVKVSVIDGLRTALPGVPDDPNLPRLMDYVRMAHLVGASCINVLHYGGTPQPIELLAEALSKVCRTAAAEGLDLCVEFIPGTGIPDLKTCLEILQLTRHSNAGVLLDSWHFARSGGMPGDIDAQTAKLIRSVQLSDRTPDQDQVVKVVTEVEIVNEVKEVDILTKVEEVIRVDTPTKVVEVKVAKVL